GEPYRFVLEGRPASEIVRPEGGAVIVTRGYFAALGIPILSGRDFSAEEIRTRKRALLVNQTLARRLWPGEDPVGKRVVFGRNALFDVIGVVGDVRHAGLRER